jgi:hypothetical protein
MSGTFPLLQHVADALHADDVLAIQVHDGVVGRCVCKGCALERPTLGRSSMETDLKDYFITLHRQGCCG